MQDASRPIWFNKENGQARTLHIGEPKYKIFVATPVHSECSIHYTQALLKFQQHCFQNNILVSFSLLKSSLVTQGRNLCVANFLGDQKTKYTHMLFIDSDIDFTFESITKLLVADKEVIAIPYPMKHIHWDQIWDRVKSGKVKSAQDLQRSGFIFPIKMDNLNGKNEISVTNGITEVSHAPTGCMLIKRQVFDKMIAAYPEDHIDQPTIVNGEAKTNPYMYNFFDTIHDPENKKYYGEDFGFCRKWTKIGGKCYIYIDDYITHVGEYQYNGRLKDNLEFPKIVDESIKTK
jgi:hypothetical protein